MRRFVAVGPAMVVLLAVVAVLLSGPAAMRRMIFAGTSAHVVLARQALEDDDILSRIDRAVENIAISVEPSVVHLEVSMVDPDGRYPGISGSSGAGWVYDSLGHIVTNAHVVSRAEVIRVEFADGRTMLGKLVATDSFTDIAVLKIDPGDGLVPAVRATGDRVHVGQRVFAFGSPFNFKFSMSEGIVSGLGRNPITRGAVNTFTNYIQTDAAVNPGNSGGPLVNARGELIGMNVAIATGKSSDGVREGQSAGISFAIPLGVIESVVDQIITSGQVKRGFLGIVGNGASSGGKAIYNDEGRFVGTGVLVGKVTPGQAADRAGIRPDDLISEIDGNKISEWHQLRSIVTAARPDSTIMVRLWRDGQELNVPVKLSEFPQESLYEESIRPELSLRLGLNLREIDGQLVVSGVDSRFGAARAGFLSGQVIEEINGEPATDWLSLYGALGRADFLYGKPVKVVVRDPDDQRHTLTLRKAK